MGVDYDAICTCQVNLSVVSSCCLFSLSVSLLLSFVSIIILYIISFVVSTNLSFCLSFSLFYFYLPFIFLYCVSFSFFPFIFILLFIRLSCIYYGNFVVSADLRCCPKQQLKSRVRISCEVKGYNVMKNDWVAWCNLDPVGDRCQKSRKTQKNIMKALEYLL